MLRQRVTVPTLCIITASAVLASAHADAAPARACDGLAQKAAALSDEDRFQANIILFAAAGGGCEDLVRDLIARGASLDARDRLGATALAHAAKAGRDRIVDMLLERGAPIDARAISGATPLYVAIEADHALTARRLIARGADVNVAGPGGLSPLAAASFNGNAELVDLLLAKGADPNALDASGKAPIVYAASRGFTRVVRRLLEAGIDVNRQYAHGLTALMWTAGYADGAGSDDIRQVLALLIERGAALDMRDDRGLSALQIARDLGHAEAADYLGAQNPAR
ncbi:MAG: hypothetical protein NVSMB26_26180 [Beijerinckiaceae bacterium]